MRDLELTTLNNGAAIEIFEHELKKVMKNIDDPSTNWKDKRVIEMKFTFNPTENRDSGLVEITSRSKLAPIKGVSSPFVLKDTRMIDATLNQQQLNFED